MTAVTKWLADELKRRRASFVLARDRRVLCVSSEAGVLPLVGALEELGEDCRGGWLADRVVGRAVAMAVLARGIEVVWAEVLSCGARQLLEGNVSLDWRQEVPVILRPDGKGVCAFERLVAGVEDPCEGYRMLVRVATGRMALPPPPKAQEGGCPVEG